MCSVLNVSRSSYYANFKKEETTQKKSHDALSKEVSKSYHESDGIYGASKIYGNMANNGNPCSIKLIQRIMKNLNLRSKTIAKYNPKNTKSNTEAPAENELNQDFTTTIPGQKIVGEITYIKTKDYGWCYLASFLELHTGELIGWAFSKNMTTELVAALKKATTKYDLSKAIIHTDQGSQYTSKAYTNEILKIGAKLSYSRKGNPYDNTCIESFHAVLKKELIYRENMETFSERQESLFKYIKGWCNTRRIQKRLGYLFPARFKKKIS